MSLNQSAPAATAPKGGDFVSFKSFPEDGPTVLTIIAYNFTKGYVNTKQDGTTEVFDALEFFMGTRTEQGERFLKTWPAKYSIHEKSNYSKLYAAATGKLPAPGSKPDDLVGLAISADLKNENKTSKKGTPYVSTRIKSIGTVHPKLKSEVVAVAALMPAFKVAMAPKDDKQAAVQKPGTDEDVPF